MKPNLSYLKSLGCNAYVHIYKDNKRKLNSHSNECIFLGHNEELKVYHLMGKFVKQIIISRYVIFDEL